MRAAGHKRVANRKLRQRRPFRRLLPAPRDVAAATWRGTRRSAPVLLAILGIALVAGAGWLGWRWVKTSSRFALHELEVEGNVRVADAEVARAAGIAPGTNVFSITPATISARVEQSPWIARARAERRLPNRLGVTVEERRPAAAVLMDGLYLADRTGRLFKRADVRAGEADGLFVVTGLERRLWQNGSEAGTALVARAVEVVVAWSRAAERPAIGEVHLDTRGITLFTREGGVALRLGDVTGADLEERFRRFDAAWEAMTPAERRAARTMHLDSTRPDRVTVKLAGTL